MREDLKSQNLTFTEIAKLVGENWQNLPPAEKEAYESQANAAKEKYHRDLVEYKKTPEYRQYAQYLREFKEKQAKQNQGSSIYAAATRNGAHTVQISQSVPRQNQLELDMEAVAAVPQLVIPRLLQVVTVEAGVGVRGCAAASRHLFHKNE